MAKQRVTGAVSSIVLVVVSVGALGVAGYNLVPSSMVPSAPATMPRPELSLSARSWLGVLGMQADALAASGVSAEQVIVVLADLQGFMDEQGDAFLSAIDAYHLANKQVDGDTRMVRAGKSPEEALLNAHAATLQAAASERSARLTAAINAASTHLTEDQRLRLAAIRSNAGREVPPAYCVVERPDAQWVALREALTAERQATERGESPAGSVTSLLSTVRGEGPTATALANAASLGAAVRQILH